MKNIKTRFQKTYDSQMKTCFCVSSYLEVSYGTGLNKNNEIESQ